MPISSAWGPGAGHRLAEQIVDAYLGASFLGSYHTQRVQKIMDLEK